MMRLRHILRTKGRGFALLALLFLTLTGCYPDHLQSTFDTSGPVARSQLLLFYWIFAAGALVFFAVEGWLLYTIIRYRRRPGQGLPPQTHGNTPLEIGWTIAPAIILAIVAVPTVVTIFDNANPPGPAEEHLKIDVIGHQWWWEFQYPDLGIATANELHIPVDTVVDTTLHSEDVIHSFWIPKLAGKQDVVPNNANPLWFQADEPGEYYGQCAEFCGTAHAQMRFRVYAHTQEEFNAWVEEQRATASLPPESDPAYRPLTTLCIACHTIEGTSLQAKQGPDLTHFGSRNTLAAGIQRNTPENLAAWLRDPEEIKPGNQMSAVIKRGTLSEEQIAALVSYLGDLK